MTQKYKTWALSDWHLIYGSSDAVHVQGYHVIPLNYQFYKKHKTDHQLCRPQSSTAVCSLQQYSEQSHLSAHYFNSATQIPLNLSLTASSKDWKATEFICYNRNNFHCIYFIMSAIVVYILVNIILQFFLLSMARDIYRGKYATKLRTHNYKTGIRKNGTPRERTLEVYLNLSQLRARNLVAHFPLDRHILA